MKSKILQEILAETPRDVEIFVRLYGDIVKRVHELIREKGFTQKQLAEKMEKKPSEVSKWLNGGHNFTLRSLAKLQAELDEPIVYVPKRQSFEHVGGNKLSMTVYKNDQCPANKKSFIAGKTQLTSLIEKVA